MTSVNSNLLTKALNPSLVVLNISFSIKNGERSNAQHQLTSEQHFLLPVISPEAHVCTLMTFTITVGAVSRSILHRSKLRQNKHKYISYDKENSSLDRSTSLFI